MAWTVFWLSDTCNTLRDATTNPEHRAAVQLHTGVFEVVALAQNERESVDEMQRDSAAHSSTCCSLCARHSDRA
jgi:hypothetical protein